MAGEVNCRPGIFLHLMDFVSVFHEGGENFIIVSFAKSLFDPINCLI